MGDDGSSVRYPERFLLVPPWASGRMIEMMVPEKVSPVKAPQGRWNRGRALRRRGAEGICQRRYERKKIRVFWSINFKKYVQELSSDMFGRDVKL